MLDIVYDHLLNALFLSSDHFFIQTCIPKSTWNILKLEERIGTRNKYYAKGRLKSSILFLIFLSPNSIENIKWFARFRPWFRPCVFSYPHTTTYNIYTIQHFVCRLNLFILCYFYLIKNKGFFFLDSDFFFFIKMPFIVWHSHNLYF